MADGSSLTIRNNSSQCRKHASAALSVKNQISVISVISVRQKKLSFSLSLKDVIVIVQLRCPVFVEKMLNNMFSVFFSFF